jgi:hypothetical protein
MTKTKKKPEEEAVEKPDKPPKLNMQVDEAWLLRLDMWRVKQGFPVISRSEAVRRMGTDRFEQDGI